MDTRSIRALGWPLFLAIAICTGCASGLASPMSGLTGDGTKSESEIRAAVRDKSNVTSLPEAGPDGL